MQSKRKHLGLAIVALALAAAAVTIVLGRNERASANPLGGFEQIGGGLYHSCGLMADNSVQCWGSIGAEGMVPGDVPGMGPSTSLANGIYHACSVVSSSVNCFGSDYGVTPVTVAAFGSNNVSVSAGWDYTCALKTTGGIDCYFADGTPLAATGLTSGISQVAASIGFHTCVLMSDGTVKCWGFNDFGQIGDGTTTPRPTAVTVSGLTNVVQVSLGTFYSCALTSSGGVKCWGDGFGLAPVDVPGLTSGIAQISANVQHLCALTSGGAVKCRGANQWGQLGDNQVCGTNFCPNVVNVDGLSSGVASIGTGVNHSCAVLVTGTAKCWGLNDLANLGVGYRSRQSNFPLDVIEANIKEVPTPTACPGVCPTATPTPFVNRTGVDYSLGIDADDNGTDDCRTVAPGPATCNLQIGAPFNLKVYLNSLMPPPPEVYDGMDIKIPYTNVVPKQNTVWIWPHCLSSASSYSEAFIALGCATTFGGSAYTGAMLQTVFTCQSSGTLALEHGAGRTGLYTVNNGYFYETQGISDQLTINCVDLPATPTFTASPTGTPTPGAVGGLGIDAERSSSATIPLLATVTVMLTGLLAYTGWRARARRTA